MRILIQTVGTRGDVQPYVALGKGLVATGHEVAICTCARFESFVTSHGIGYERLNNDLLEFMDTEDGRIAMENTGNLFEAIRTGIKLFPKIGDMMTRQVDEMWQACESFQPELILFHKKAIGAEDFAEKRGISCALAFYLPLYVPTGEFPAMGFPRWPLGRWYNRLTYRIVDWVTRISSSKFTRLWRKKQGLPKRRASNSRSSTDRPIPVLHAFSPSVISEPADWPETAKSTGYWFLDEPILEWSPSPELLQFLANDSPPIYVGFGSIFGRDAMTTTKIVVDAITQAEVRAVVATGWGGLNITNIELPENVLAIESAPHDWLFPQVAAVVHHGGCGTTAAGLRAGKPTVICPFFGDQPFWGDIVHRLGVGPLPIPQKKLTAEKLSLAIRAAVNDESIRSSSEAIGRQIRDEDGVAEAVAFIERLFQ